MTQEKKPCPGCGQIHEDLMAGADAGDRAKLALRVREEGERLAIQSAALANSVADKSLPPEAVQAVWMGKLMASCIYTRVLQQDKIEAARWIKLVFTIIDKELVANGVRGFGFGMIEKEVPHAEA